MTGAHIASLEQLETRSIDACSIDSVTWGFFKKFRHSAAERFRILDETVSSPSLPFVTWARTEQTTAVALTEAIYEIMKDPQMSQVREMLGLTGLSPPGVVAYENLAQYEREASELGFPEIR
jgi:ABC-type phosphate/phosphonate transport system substrate-binding protein